MTIQLDEVAPAWCLRLISEFNSADERAIAVTKLLTIQELNWKPSADEWSVGQCIEHLCIANELYCRAISSSLFNHPVAIVQEITPGWLGRWFIRNYIEPSLKVKRRRAPRKIRPSQLVELSVLGRFLESNHWARSLVHRSRNYDVNRIRFRNPFVPVIYFTVGTGLEILSKHERRHLLQAERVRDSLKRERGS